MGRTRAGWSIHGVDFTSSPRPRKCITIACGHLQRSAFRLTSIESHAHWEGFESWLRRAGPWIAGFDFPFGLPREAVVDLRWPLRWPRLVRHCRALGRDAFRAALDGHRIARPAGNRYAHRAADLPARSHSPLKLVNPPVGLMFLEGAPRLLDAGVCIPGVARGDSQRVALEAYPGFAARRITKQSYKNDAVSKHTPGRWRARAEILDALSSMDSSFGFALSGPKALLQSLLEDGSGDRLDATLCAMQAAWAWLRRAENYGLPESIDPLEGWIVTVPNE